ncbi:MAG: hypothetical protein KKB46_02685 [Candidatus Omnitrophica bacterium]|nr:hypothetical protein [Candidatus Omnitrophota bacterium]
MADFIRVWKEVDIEDVRQHLLIVGESKGDCSSCRALGIDYSSTKTCPNCNTVFKYVASRTREIKKIKTKRPDLIFIDMEDYKKITGRLKAQDLFSSKTLPE